MRHALRWRNACVVRAQTIAANLRMIEFAVDGGLAAFGQGAATCVLAGGPGSAAAISTHNCVYVGQDRMRVLVAGREGSQGERFMWSLIEGARVLLTVPAAQTSRAAELRIACRTGIRLRFASAGWRSAVEPTHAANGNTASRRIV